LIKTWMIRVTNLIRYQVLHISSLLNDFCMRFVKYIELRIVRC